MTESVERPAEPAMRIVADDVLAWVQPDGSWWINNAGAIITSGGVILIDTCATERRTRALLGALDRATGGTRVTYAVNTHQHGDHAYGNSLLPESTVIIGHEATRAALLADPVIDGCPPFWEPVPDWGNVTRRPPTLTTSTSIVLHHGNCRVELLHPGYPAHTAGDLVAWLPAQRILFTGDLLFNKVTPLIFMGSLDGARRVLDWIAAFEPEWVIPGHGAVMAARDLSGVLDAHHRYYRLVADTAHAGLRDGLSPMEAAAGCDLGSFAALPDAERIVLNLHRAYSDIGDHAFDLARAFIDAMAYNGGPMHTAV